MNDTPNEIVADKTDNITKRLNNAKAEGMRDAAKLIAKMGLLGPAQLFSIADLIDEVATGLESP